MEKVCFSVTGWAVVRFPPERRAGWRAPTVLRSGQQLWALFLLFTFKNWARSFFFCFSLPHFIFCTPFKCFIPPSSLPLYPSPVLYKHHSLVSAPGRSCNTSVWSILCCRTWTWGPEGSTPPCLHLCILRKKETMFGYSERKAFICMSAF